MSYFDSIYAANLPSRAVAVYMYLRDRAHTQGSCFPAICTIASELHLSRSTVKRAIVDLEQAGFVAKQQRYRASGAKSSCLYIVK